MEELSSFRGDANLRCFSVCLLLFRFVQGAWRFGFGQGKMTKWDWTVLRLCTTREVLLQRSRKGKQWFDLIE